MNWWTQIICHTFTEQKKKKEANCLHCDTIKITDKYWYTTDQWEKLIKKTLCVFGMLVEVYVGVCSGERCQGNMPQLYPYSDQSKIFIGITGFPYFMFHVHPPRTSFSHALTKAVYIIYWCTTALDPHQPLI